MSAMSFSDLRQHASILKNHAWLERFRKAKEGQNNYNKMSDGACKDIARFVDKFIADVLETIDVVVPEPATAVSVVIDHVDLRDPLAAFTNETALNEFLRSRGGGSVRRVPLNPAVSSAEVDSGPVYLAVIVDRLLRLSEPVQLTEAPKVSWEILGPRGDSLVVRVELNPQQGMLGVNGFALRQAMHLIDAGIWLAEDAWQPWFESIAREVESQMSLWYRPVEHLPKSFGVALDGVRLHVETIYGQRKFPLHPTAEHPNGDATVKWIMREIERSTKA